ncbi:MAG: hypothetical protein ABI134_22125 [Byssovorax sp.]
MSADAQSNLLLLWGNLYAQPDFGAGGGANLVAQAGQGASKDVFVAKLAP